MASLTLDHSETPAPLAKLNVTLSALLNQTHAEDPDGSLNQALDTEIQKIIDERANLVESLLSSLQEQQKRSFARKELNANQVILDLGEAKRQQVRQHLTSINKASKAIKEYRQV